jgi:hypothetical protein
VRLTAHAQAVLLAVAVGTLSVTGAGSALANSDDDGLHIKKSEDTFYLHKADASGPAPLTSVPICPLTQTIEQNQDVGGSNSSASAVATTTYTCNVTINSPLSGGTVTSKEKTVYRKHTEFSLDKEDGNRPRPPRDSHR